ncbi:hypothetical protein BKA64DRAFT_642147 [Cadophora sp. MPI-SDFR-AT-0126]|nr:hypothetical protein BKA64DRAFT_642147 [Leotiomycetes sp. MPI-SDFR-AT-0126]
MAYGAQVTSEQRRAVPHLAKYKCRVCEKWKETASFSNKELGSYSNKVACGNKLNGITAKLRCRNCSGGALTEKFCEGPCRTWKDLQKFSKSARSNGGSQCCKSCVLWAETQEPDMVAAAPPVGDNIDGEDEDDDHWSPGAATYSDPEAGDSDSDYEDYGHTTTSNAGSRASNVPAPVPGARQTPSIATSLVGPRQHINVPYESLAALSLNGSNTISNPGTGQTMATANLPTPTMSGSRMPSGSRVGSRSTVTPKNFDVKSQSSASAPSGQWGAMDARRRDPVTQRPAPIQYTAWDNKGQPHIHHRVPSGSGSQSQQSSSLPSARTPPAPPAPVPTVRNTNWAKPVGSRGAQRTIPPPDGVRPGAAGPVPISRPLAESRPDDDDTDEEDDLYDM